MIMANNAATNQLNSSSTNTLNNNVSTDSQQMSTTSASSSQANTPSSSSTSTNVSTTHVTKQSTNNSNTKSNNAQIVSTSTSSSNLNQTTTNVKTEQSDTNPTNLSSSNASTTTTSNSSNGSSNSNSTANDDSKWIFSTEKINFSPSRSDNISLEDELNERQEAALFISDLGATLKVNQLCINTAIIYMHRFYMIHSLKKFHRYVRMVATSCLFFACKVEEQPRRLREFIDAIQRIFHKSNEPVPQNSEEYHRYGNEIIALESCLLQTLGFNVLINHAHTVIIKTCHMIKAPRDLAEAAYLTATNSLILTNFCVKFPPEKVACFCIYLACKWTGLKIPTSSEGLQWYQYVKDDIVEQELEDISKEYLTIYDKCPPKIQKKLGKTKNVDDTSQQQQQAQQKSQKQVSHQQQPHTPQLSHKKLAENKTPGGGTQKTNNSTNQPIVNNNQQAQQQNFATSNFNQQGSKHHNNINNPHPNPHQTKVSAPQNGAHANVNVHHFQSQQYQQQKLQQQQQQRPISNNNLISNSNNHHVINKTTPATASKDPNLNRQHQANTNNNLIKNTSSTNLNKSNILNGNQTGATFSHLKMSSSSSNIQLGSSGAADSFNQVSDNAEQNGQLVGANRLPPSQYVKKQQQQLHQQQQASTSLSNLKSTSSSPSTPATVAAVTTPNTNSMKRVNEDMNTITTAAPNKIPKFLVDPKSAS